MGSSNRKPKVGHSSPFLTCWTIRTGVIVVTLDYSERRSLQAFEDILETGELHSSMILLPLSFHDLFSVGTVRT